MKLQIISHACMRIEHAGVVLLTDPWLRGSCYWRSWWNFPEPDEDLVQTLEPNYVYLSHLHWDHFHGASLKHFSKSTQFLIPFTSSSRFRKDLEYLGFKKILELAHGRPIQLAPDLKVTSFQFGFSVDSALVVEGGGTTLLDVNDCKFFGLPLRQIQSRFSKIDFVLRSHSSASALPYCIDGYQARFANWRSQEDYISEFAKFSLHLGCRYAVPFASNHCFLHRDTIQFNETSTSPDQVEKKFQAEANACGSPTTCVVMPPGSSWSDREGFQITPFDYSKKAAYVERLSEKHRQKLLDQYRLEESTVADFGAFRAYFAKFTAVLPALLPRQRLKIGFRIKDAAGTHFWLVDCGERKVLQDVPENLANVIIETPALVLNQCTQRNMFSVWTASKRLRIFLPRQDFLSVAQTFFGLLDLYELDCLPLWKNFTLTAIRSRWRRWRELLEAIRVLWKVKVLRRPFSLASYYSPPDRLDLERESGGARLGRGGSI
jgi:UDP-MurNAc hydroxylase